MPNKLDFVSLCVGSTFAVVAMYQFGPRAGDYKSQRTMKHAAISSQEQARDMAGVLKGQSIADYPPETRLFIARSVDLMLHSAATELYGSRCTKLSNPLHDLGIHDENFSPNDILVTSQASPPQTQ